LPVRPFKLDGLVGCQKKWLFIAALVFISPETPGVFELWDEDELIYVGSTRRPEESIRNCLIRHLREEGAGEHPPTHFSWEVSYRPGNRRHELLAQFVAINQRPPRFNSDEPRGDR
jgi:hypothetical protein